MTETLGINADETTAWMQQHVGAQPPLTFQLIAGGHSNLTYKVTDATGHAWALRRPPTGMVLATAHDMGREWTFISALHGTPAPVAVPAAFCDDHSVNGADFYLTEFVDGTVLNAEPAAANLTDEVKRRAARSTIDTLVAMHSVDVDAVGLGELRRPGNYIERQLRRWYRQVHESALTDFTVLDEVHRRLSADVPDAPSRIAHGDFRPGNLSYGPDGTVLAIYDWELATIGDPMADLAWLLGSWRMPGDEFPAVTETPTTAGGFPTRDELAGWYAEGTGADLSRLDYYIAFARWRGACIGAGVWSRYKGGVMGEMPKDMERREEQVYVLAETALACLR